MKEKKAIKKLKKLYSGKWAIIFFKYHEDNPHIYELFKKFTFEAIERGHKHFGSQTVINRIRWYTNIETKGDPFKINSNVSAYYSRLFMKQFEEHDDYFRTRQVRDNSKSLTLSKTKG